MHQPPPARDSNSTWLPLALSAAQVIGAATLFRSIAFDRWISVLGAALILLGVEAARRGRVWGIGLILAASSAFPVSRLAGNGPSWFWVVGLIGALPFLLTYKSMARFDKAATAFFASLALTGGSVVALAWKQFGWPIIYALPTLMPSTEAQHGLLLAAVALVLGGLESKRRYVDLEKSRVRITTTTTRIATSTSESANEALDEDSLALDELIPARAARRVESRER